MTLTSEVEIGQRHWCSAVEGAPSTSPKWDRTDTSLRKETSRTRSCREKALGQDVELVAFPVSELTDHLHISKDQVVVLTFFATLRDEGG